MWETSFHHLDFRECDVKNRNRQDRQKRFLCFIFSRCLRKEALLTGYPGRSRLRLPFYKVVRSVALPALFAGVRSDSKRALSL